MNNEQIIKEVMGRKERGLEAIEIIMLINKTLQLKEKEFKKERKLIVEGINKVLRIIENE